MTVLTSKDIMLKARAGKSAYDVLGLLAKLEDHVVANRVVIANHLVTLCQSKDLKTLSLTLKPDNPILQSVIGELDVRNRRQVRNLPSE